MLVADVSSLAETLISLLRLTPTEQFWNDIHKISTRAEKETHSKTEKALALNSDS